MVQRRSVHLRRPWARLLARSAVAALAAACAADPVAAPAPPADSGTTDAPVRRVAPVGAQCRGDEDCGGALRCLASTADDLAPGLGGPPHGLCSVECTSVADCPDPVTAVCASPFAGGPSFCIPACTPGDVPNAEGKCLGRYDLACQPLFEDPSSGFCVPSCGGPTDCPGAECDLATGMCVPAIGPGLPLGADCARGSCASGVCIQYGRASVCSGFCTLGTAGCGADPTSPERLDAYCTLSQDSTLGHHDVGMCAQLCDCDADCRHPALVCEPIPPTSALVTSARGRRGSCAPAELATANLACSDGGTHDGGTRDGGEGVEAGARDAGPRRDASPPDAGPGPDASAPGRDGAGPPLAADAGSPPRADGGDAGRFDASASPDAG